MKKPNPYLQNLLRIKREKKRLKRKRKRKVYTGTDSTYKKEIDFRIKQDKYIISSYQSLLYDYLLGQSFIDGTEISSLQVKIPADFSLRRNYEGALKTIRNVVFSMWKNAGGEIVLDFSECQNVDQTALFLLQILRLELLSDLYKLDQKLKILKSIVKFKIKESKSESVNFNLFLCGYLSNLKVIDGLVPIDTIGYMKGTKSQKSYLENKKGVIGTKIVSYINKCLRNNHYTLTVKGKNELGGMIGEILNNAEDHSPTNTYYVTANYYIDEGKRTSTQGSVGVLNLSFMNFGFSIYEGFEQTKEDNYELYNILEDQYTKLNDKRFTKENIFTLYALQDGISRLKFEDASRGSGTMTFVNCFYAIGDYENIERELSPHLTILSGNTQLICNNNYPPIIGENGNNMLTLNNEKDLSAPPDPQNLMSLKQKFPGTILSVRFCLNKDHIQKKIEKSNGN